MTPTAPVAGPALPDQLSFATSGTTGRPVTWWRTRDQVLAEAGLLIENLRLRGVDQVLTYAPTDHLYGFLFGSVVPTLLGVPVRPVDTVGPLPAGDGHPAARSDRRQPVLH